MISSRAETSSSPALLGPTPETGPTAIAASALSPLASEASSASSVEYSSGVTFNGTTYRGTARGDSISFINSVSEGTQVVLGRGGDSISFGGTARIGAGTVVDLGADGSIDRLVIASEELVKGSGLRVLNFQDGVDKLTVGGVTYNSRAEAAAAINASQSGSISFDA